MTLSAAGGGLLPPFRMVAPAARGTAFIAAFACGFMATPLSVVVTGMAPIGPENILLAITLLIVTIYLLEMITEGFVTAFCVAFSGKVQPDLLPHDKPMEMPLVGNQE